MLGSDEFSGWGLKERILSMVSLLRGKLSDRYRQYGLRRTLLRMGKAFLRPVFDSESWHIFVMMGFCGRANRDAGVRQFTQDRIQNAMEQGLLSRSRGALFIQFIQSGCKGFIMELQGEVAGYGWVQFEGEYELGRGIKMKLSAKEAVVNNIHVFSKFRGRSLGTRLNAACLSAIPCGYLPIVWILAENRYAIRSWKRLGASPVLVVSRICLGSKTYRIIVKQISNIRGFQDWGMRIYQGCR